MEKRWDYLPVRSFPLAAGPRGLPEPPPVFPF